MVVLVLGNRSFAHMPGKPLPGPPGWRTSPTSLSSSNRWRPAPCHLFSFLGQTVYRACEGGPARDLHRCPWQQRTPARSTSAHESSGARNDNAKTDAAVGALVRHRQYPVDFTSNLDRSAIAGTL